MANRPQHTPKQSSYQPSNLIFHLHMQQTPPSSSPRKRRRCDRHSFENRPSFELEVKDCQIVAKQLWREVDTPNPQPATTQHHASATSVTRAALRALNQKNKQAAQEAQSRQRLRRPVAGLALAEWTECHPNSQPCQTYLERCGHEQSAALKRFAEEELDLQDLRGCHRAAVHSCDTMESSEAISTRHTSQSRQSTKTRAATDRSTNKPLSPYNRPFQQLLVDSHIYPPYYEHPDGTAAPEPANLDSISKKLAQRRPSLSSSKFGKKEHAAFIRKDVNATNEDDVRRNVIPEMQGTIKDPQTVRGEVLFVNLTPLTTDEKVASSKPDCYHGARPEQLKRSIRKALNHLIVPSTHEDLAILPSHFTAVKGPDGHASVAKRQATYDAYLGARGIHALQNYGRAEPIFDNKAYTFAFIYHSPTLSVFVCHPVRPADPGGPPSYYMTPLGSFSMLHDVKTWREGATWCRNAIDLAKEWRDEFVRRANDVVQASAPTPSASTRRASTGDPSGALTVASQVDDAARGSDEEALFETAESSQEEEEEGKWDEEEAGCSSKVPEQSSRSRARGRLGRKRQDREDSTEDRRTARSPRQGDTRSSFAKPTETDRMKSLEGCSDGSTVH